MLRQSSLRFSDLAGEMALELGEPIDHFHGTLPNGEEVILWHETYDGEDYGWQDLFGWAHEPYEFVLLEGHRFHGRHERTQKEQEVPEPKPDGWLARFMKRVVGW